MRAVSVLLVLCVACGSDPPTTALFAPPGTGDDFYALPYPNDVWRKSDGTLDLSQFPTNSLIVDTYRIAAQSLDGFGLNAAIYARFDAELDPKNLPDPAGSLDPSSPVYLVCVDRASPAYGQRVPLVLHFRADPTQTIGPNNLVVRPYPGFGLTGGTTYALVITRRLRDSHGNPVRSAPAFDDVMAGAGDPAIAAAYAPLLSYLDDPADDERADVVSATVFTTQHATTMGPALRKAVFSTAAPVATDVMAMTAQTFTLYTGNYIAPNLQTGTPPYHDMPLGEIQVGADGAAIVQRMEPMRFALTVPPGAVPAAGFPIVIYAHGTGGDYKSFVDDGTANALAMQGLAVISTDQVLHGPRNPGGDPELDYFNFTNPYAIRDNTLQGAADAWSQMRLAEGLTVHVPAVDNRTIKLDTSRVYFFGHSQGGLTGPAFVAFEPKLAGAVLSGTGGLLYVAVMHKTSPLNIPDLVETLIRDEPVDEDNPTLALFQMWGERSDGVNYAPLFVRNLQATPDGTATLAPRNIFQTEGFTDTYAPNPSIEAFATAVGGDLVMLPDTQEVEGLDLRERTIDAPPISDNMGGATAVLAQYQQRQGSDGHFVVFEIPQATREASQFLGSLAKTGTATVVP